MPVALTYRFKFLDVKRIFMKITTENIKSYSGLDVFNKGLRYYKQDKVRLMDVELLNFEATVNGSDEYIVNVELVGEKIYGSCTCPYWTTCKHIVAALLTAKDYYDNNLDELLYQCKAFLFHPFQFFHHYKQLFY